MQREDAFEQQIRIISAQLKEVSIFIPNNISLYSQVILSLPFHFQAEARAEFAERTVMKLQKDVDRLEGWFTFDRFETSILLFKEFTNILNLFGFSDEWAHEKEKYKAISDEMDQTFAELTGY